MISQDYLHLTFQDEDKLLPLMNRGLCRFHCGGLESHDKRLHMAIFLIEPERFI